MPANDRNEIWIREGHENTSELGFRIERTLFSQRSRFQQVDVLKTKNHGVILVNDGIVMLTERDEFIYHEMIAHVPLFVHPRAKQILVIGGGDGGTVREVLKHRSVERVVMVEIDEMVVRACREHLPAVGGALDDSRLELVFEDGIQYVAETDARFDIVMVDSSDPVGPGTGLFERSFYEHVAGILKPDGILITQAESAFYDHALQKSMFSSQRPFFKKLHMYLYTTLAYPGGLYGFGFASQGLCPVKDFSADRVKAANLATRYYNARIHRAAFMLPVFLEEALAGVLDPAIW
ncbi:MAG: polyamine aminopropyltransferase [Desulfobacterales bacterium]|nr:MAG: polyamine aminopropyltransferase [Desulfobacterales bacterium]